MVVVSHAFWRGRLGADPGAVGRALIVNGEPYTIVGVLPKGLKAMPGFGLAPEVYLPLSRTLLPGLDHPHAAAAQLVGRLKPGVGIDQAAAALDTVVQRRRLEDPDRPRHLGEMTPVTSGLHGLGSISSFFAVLVVVGGLVLGIACANVAGLLLARNTVRQKELALRAALGASRARVAQQLFVESIWLAGLGTITGVLFMALAMRVDWRRAAAPAAADGAGRAARLAALRPDAVDGRDRDPGERHAAGPERLARRAVTGAQADRARLRPPALDVARPAGDRPGDAVGRPPW